MVSLVWTLGAKLVVIRSHTTTLVAAAFLEASLSDLVFFSAAGLLFELLLLTGSSWAARGALLGAAGILGWSVANAAWFIGTSVQLQPGLLGMLAQSPGDYWPLVEGELREHPLATAAMFLTMTAAGAWLCLRLLRPAPIEASRRQRARRAGIAAAVLLMASVGYGASRREGRELRAVEAVRFSSHAAALAQILTPRPAADLAAGARSLPRVGQRRVVLPRTRPEDRPNVVVILLESVSLDATSLGGKATTPHLARLAAEGVEVAETRVPVPQTSKAFWTTLTGSLPDVRPDYVEAVLMDEPYESLASLLARQGYESAFFQMSRGSFGTTPGLFANLAYDHAWFREDLGDPSAHLGYFNGDDFRMIGPMFEWVDRRQGPFLLTLITSVAHMPYRLPAWYGTDKDGRTERYLDAVRFTDAFVGEVRRELEHRGLLETTLLCVLGDHGEGFRAESRFPRWAPFEEVIRVPWILRWPQHLEAGRVIAWPASQADVTPTLLSLLGFGIEAAGFDGKDALGPTPPNRRHYFSVWFPNSPIGFVEGDRKLVYWPYVDHLAEYDLAADPGETSPRTLVGSEKERWLADIRRWRRGTYIDVPAHRFRERRLYGRWQTFSSGRIAKTIYIPKP